MGQVALGHCGISIPEDGQKPKKQQNNKKPKTQQRKTPPKKNPTNILDMVLGILHLFALLKQGS